MSECSRRGWLTWAEIDNTVVYHLSLLRDIVYEASAESLEARIMGGLDLQHSDTIEQLDPDIPTPLWDMLFRGAWQDDFVAKVELLLRHGCSTQVSAQVWRGLNSYTAMTLLEYADYGINCWDGFNWNGLSNGLHLKWQNVKQLLLQYTK